MGKTLPLSACRETRDAGNGELTGNASDGFVSCNHTVADWPFEFRSGLSVALVILSLRADRLIEYLLSEGLEKRQSIIFGQTTHKYCEKKQISPKKNVRHESINPPLGVGNRRGSR